ncbi:hypothetical protein SCLCIDRAFT_106764 [Scleroderma citrinum Foug A]|uniref:Transcription initiation factor TFIID subunit 8 n=1 Tax=Scleroderma citrinum Foug A TaxID=1036808 RepID=A0A0C3EIW5_9AGAM|nr:hypothetical protein SCLCIDRAFT_106764 [Scleroderma citrinum Foug A]
MSGPFPGYPAFAYQAAYAPYVTAPGQPVAVPFPTQFPIPGYQIIYGLPPPKPPTTSTPNQLPVAPDIPGISQEIASNQIQKLIVSHLKQTQFEAIEPRALQRLELEVVAFVQRLFEGAHEYANLANRATPIAKDVLMACYERGVTVDDLRAITAKHNIDSSIETLFENPPPRTRSPELLQSDDEGSTPTIPTTLRQIPSNFPPLPPKHTYLKTPASPPKKAALPSLERKLKTASLVQESLKNLLTATEDNFGQEDGELLGHIVNWEVSTYPRKRWRVSAA